MDKRIIEETPSTEVLNDDWFIKDSPTGGTSKILGSNLKSIISGDVEDAIDKILDSIAPEWSSTFTYGYDAYVIYEGELWRCFKDTGSTRGEFKTSEWIKGVTSGYITHVVNKIADRFVASNPPFMIYRYSVGDMVFYSEPYHDEQLYVCNTDLPQGESTFNPEHWDVVYTVAGLSKYLMDKIAEAGQIDDVQVKTTGDYESVVDENKVAKIDLSNKADKDGMYDELYAGNLLSDNTETDNAPYTYRPSPSGKSYVDLSVVGGTVAWNQQLSLSNLPSDSALYSNTTYTVNGVTFTKNNDGSITIQTESGGATSETSVKIGSVARLEFIKNHIHYIPRCKGGSASTYYFNYAGSRYVYDNDKIFAKQPSGFNMWLTVKQGTVITTPVKVYPQVVDLEQMFGTTIANAVYTMEQAEAGSGIAWLKSYGFLTKDYYAYDSGSLQSVNVASRKVVGKNLFDIHIDKDTPLTTITLAQPINQPITISAVDNNITVNDNVWRITITLKDGTNVRIGEQGFWAGTFPKTIDGSDANPIVSITYCGENITSGSYDVQVELGTTATTYEPYKTWSYPLDNSLTLRGIPKLDSNNKLYYDGDIYESDGSVMRKYGFVDLGSLEWSYNSSRALFVALISDGKATGINTGNGGGITVKYTTVIKTYGDMVSGEMSIGSNYSSSSTCALLIKDSAYTDTPTFKTAMSGVYLVYELATPTAESAQPYTNPQLVGSTEEFIDAGTSASTPTRDVPIPVGQDSKYHTDLKAKLEELAKIPDVPSTNGTYTLKATRSASGVTYSWVSG